MIEIKLRPFDTSSGANRCHASVVAVDVRGRTVGTAELGVPLETIYAMGHFGPAKLRQWETRLQELVDEIARVAP